MFTNNKINKMKKSPIGIMPKFIHDELRADQLRAAIKRYKKANKPIPKEWIKELKVLTK